MSFQILRKTCVPVLIGALFMTTSAASAGTTHSGNQAPVVLASAQLNLLRGAEARTRGKARKRVALGKGSYICSPAGFGKRSRCYSN